MERISAKTKQLGVIGCPVEHSFSPRLHNFLSARMNNDYVYSAWRVEEGNVGAAIDGVRALGIRGINVTAPHKKEVMKYLDEISEQAKLLDAVNTVVNDGGKLYGYNTDADGFLRSLEANDIRINGKKILVLGAGGVVKPTVLRIAQDMPKSIVILNRTSEKAERIARDVKATVGYDVDTAVTTLDFDVVINMTSAGMEPQEDALPIDNIAEIESMDFINADTAVVDMIYNPWETKFLREAKKRGAKIMNGLDMLIYQGITAYELFTGTTLPKGIADEVRAEVFGR